MLEGPFGLKKAAELVGVWLGVDEFGVEALDKEAAAA